MPKKNDKAPAPPKKRDSDSDVAEGRSPIRRLIRGAFALAVFVGIALVVGSYFIRKEVIRRVRDRAVTATSAVFGRPYPINVGQSISKTKLLDRLRRLAYHKVSGVPEHAGAYSLESGKMWLYVRGSSANSAPERLAEISLSPQQEITGIRETKFEQPIKDLTLEPELLSLLGDTATRASTPKRLEEFPPQLINALLAIEDERFYQHFGIDPLGLGRAIFVNLTSGRLAQGGSTITQQLAKNLFFTRERTFVRKAFEAMAAVLLETAFTKDQILELYLNEIFLGQEGNVAIHGFGEASRSFFGKEASDLSLAEVATLAGVIKAPTRLSPRLYPKNARDRRLLVLEKMEELKFITPEERTRASLETLQVRAAERARRVAPYFVDFIRRRTEERFDIENVALSKLQIVTGLDLEYQHCADLAIENGLKQLEQTYPRLKPKKGPSLQASLIAVEPVHGDVLAWIGGRDYGDNQFDRVSQSKRQPGSTFKPFVYLTALDKQLNNYRVARTTSILVDEPTSIPLAGGKTWQPSNYDEEYRGEVTLREALAHSLNVPTVQLAMKVGIDSIARTAELFGFGNSLPRVPSLALGAGEVSPFDLARAYAAIANGGLLINLKPISAVMLENDPNPVSRAEWKEERVASEPAVYVLTNILQSVIESGTGKSIRRLGFTAPPAGKTRTSNDARDAWFAGFTPRILAVVWVGYDDNREMKLTGGQAAAPIWAEFMKCAAPMEPQLDFIPPAGVVFKDIDRRSGLLITPTCPPENRIPEVFVEGTEPVTPCPLHSRDVYADESMRPVEPGDSGLPPAARDPRGLDDKREVLSPPSSSVPRRKRPQGLWEQIFGN